VDVSLRVVALVGGAHGGAWNDVRNDDALGSASRVPVWRVVVTGVQIGRSG